MGGPIAGAAAKKIAISKIQSTLISKGLEVLSIVIPDAVSPVAAMYKVAGWSNAGAKVGIVLNDADDFKNWVLDDDGCVVLDLDVNHHAIVGNLQLILGTQTK